MEKDKKGPRNIKSRCVGVTCPLAAIAVILSLGCLVFEIYTVVELPDLSKYPQTSFEDTSLCVECTRLMGGPVGGHQDELMKKLSKSVASGKQMCCAYSPEQMSAFLEMVLMAKRIAHAPTPTYQPDDFTFSFASAHKRLLPSVPYISKPGIVPQFSNNSNIPLKLDLAETDPLVEHARNVEVLETGLHVLNSGMYFVYSSIRFNPDSTKPCKDFDKQTWHHDVLRIRPNKRQSSGVILSSLHSCCDDCVRDKETSYTGGAFYLQAGDHLHVEVSGYALIRFDKQASYFGLYMLGGDE